MSATPPTGTGDTAATGGSRAAIWPLLVIGLLVALLLAAVVSFYASSHPDGLERVAGQYGMDAEVRDPLVQTPFLDYQTSGVQNERLSQGTAGALGTLATLGAAGALFLVLRPRRRENSDQQETPIG